MSDPSLDTVHIQACIDRMRGGDRRAADELLRASAARLELLARRMLRGFPNVKRWADTGDVLQSALMRLVRALDQVRPDSTRAFFGLAAEHIRRELLDLARHYYGPHGLGARYAGPVGGGGSDLGIEPEDPAGPPGDLDRWAALHEAVEKLPADEREVFMLAFYHGWPQARVAELFGVDERTIRRRWKAAGRRLQELLGGDLPGTG